MDLGELRLLSDLAALTSREDATHDEFRGEDELLRRVQRRKVLLVKQLWSLLERRKQNLEINRH